MKFLARFFRRVPARKARVECDEVGMTLTTAAGRQESVRWDDLHEVFIVTTDEGPLVDDVFWMLRSESGGCAVPSETAGVERLIERLQQLPGFNNRAVIQAMGSTDNARFVCWDRDPPAG